MFPANSLARLRHEGVFPPSIRHHQEYTPQWAFLRMSKENDPRPDEDFDTRLRRARGSDAKTGPGGSAALPEDGKGKAMRISAELVVAVAVGGGIGFFIDDWLGTKPWFLISFLFLGNAAGLWNVFRLTKNQGYSVGFERGNRSPANDMESDTEQDIAKGK